MDDREALFEGLFKRRPESSPTAQELYETFLKAYNPEKKRFKDQGWQNKFKKQVAEHAEELKRELDQHRNEGESMSGQFWKAIKRLLPLEISYQRTAPISSFVRKAAAALTASGGYAQAPRDFEFDHHVIRKDDHVRWEGRDYGGQYRVKFKTDRGQTMGYLIYDSSAEFEKEWDIRTATYHLNGIQGGMRWGEFLAALDEQHQNEVPLRNIELTEKYLGRKIAAGTEDGKWGFEFIEEETREAMSFEQQTYFASSSVHRVIEAFNLES